jgi:hypothetical protein
MQSRISYLHVYYEKYFKLIQDWIHVICNGIYSFRMRSLDLCILILLLHIHSMITLLTVVSKFVAHNISDADRHHVSDC